MSKSSGSVENLMESLRRKMSQWNPNFTLCYWFLKQRVKHTAVDQPGAGQVFVLSLPLDVISQIANARIQSVNRRSEMFRMSRKM